MTCRSLCRIVAFVPHQLIPEYERKGWMRLAQLGPTHGKWSELLGWPCDCEVWVPEREVA